MIENTLELLRPAIRNLKAYSSARSLATSARVYLDANESPLAPGPDDHLKLNRYPEPQPQRLRELFSLIYEVEPEQLLVGRGSDEAIEILVRAFCEAKEDSILVCPPTYGVYQVAADIQGASVVKVPLLQRGLRFELDVAGILNSWRPGVKLVFLCSPNNPTGTLFDEDDVLTIVQGLQGKAVVVVDEAYLEFARLATGPAPSFARRIRQFPNLVVLRTLSKAWSLAGARCGVAIAQPALIEALQRLRAPYPLSAPAIECVLNAVGEQRGLPFERRIQHSLWLREQFEEELSELPNVEEISPSQANFLLVRFHNAADLMQRSRERGILIRDRGGEPGLHNCIRISIGSAHEMSELLTLFKTMDRAPRMRAGAQL